MFLLAVVVVFDMADAVSLANTRLVMCHDGSHIM